MTQSPPIDTLEIEVKNFGPITAAKIDLRPLTLFIGPSNSGKSYFSTLIYALHCGLGKAYGSADRSEDFEWECSKNDIRELASWLDSHFVEPPGGSSTGNNSMPALERFELPEKISQLVHPALRANSDFGPAVKDQVERCFGAESIQSLIRQSGSGHGAVSNKATVTLKKITKTHRNSTESFACNLEFNVKNSKCSVDISPRMPLCILNPTYDLAAMNLCIALSGEDLFGRRIYEAPSHQIIGAHLASSVFSNSIDPIGRIMHYLPADRSGVMRTYRLLMSSAVKHTAKARIGKRSDAPVLSGVLADFLDQMMNINDRTVSFMSDSRLIGKYLSHRAPAEHFELLASVTKDVELSVLGGVVHSEASDNSVTSYPDFSYTPSGWSNSLPLMLASSMVSELSPIVLYLRNVVFPGDVLIIEEPEAHLHPDLQVKFVSVLAELVKAGVRIILTTHSEWVLDTVANLVLSSEVDGQNDDDPSVALSSQDVGLWEFVPKKRPKGSIVQEIKFDFEKGGFVTEFESVAGGIYNRWANLGNRINEKAEKSSSE